MTDTLFEIIWDVRLSKRVERKKGGKVGCLQFDRFLLDLSLFSFYYFEQCVFFQFQTTKLTVCFISLRFVVVQEMKL